MALSYAERIDTAPWRSRGRKNEKTVAFDLDDEKAVDYSTQDPYLPYEAIGDYLFNIESYVEFDGHNGEKDIAILSVVESNNPDIKPGERYAFTWATDVKGDGRALAAARLRGFIMAANGVEAKDARACKAGVARKAILEEDYSKGGNLVRLKRGEKQGKKGTIHEGKTFSDDRWSPA